MGNRAGIPAGLRSAAVQSHAGEPDHRTTDNLMPCWTWPPITQKERAVLHDLLRQSSLPGREKPRARTRAWKFLGRYSSPSQTWPWLLIASGGFQIQFSGPSSASETLGTSPKEL
ncbi:hypothetical protein NHX12_029973 [Muraenolepis orangiensis]|uniref:Uncharacterized protein n=1 Tax=Muraenolepis orangiensis TaxID=630683 RepID=A0A9Q0IKK8_9TELE|nr:hypothetical protein NHX12_029973 [Muraenolepis orangiensis]